MTELSSNQCERTWLDHAYRRYRCWLPDGHDGAHRGYWVMRQGELTMPCAARGA